MKNFVWLSIVCLLSQPLYANDDWQLFRSGDAFDLKTNDPLYREQHYMRCSDQEHIRVEYLQNGQVFAEKDFRFIANSFVPDLEFHDMRLQRHISLRQAAGFVAVQTNDEKASLPLRADLVADAGFDRFIAAHAAQLNNGQPLAFSFVSPTRLDSYRFEVLRQSSGDGLALLLQPEAKWLQWLLDPIYLRYESKPFRLLEYAGISNIEDLQEKYLHVRIAYRYYPVCGLAGSTQ
ncbi:MAG: hypothetical protein H7A09_07060 [Oceanospirillaceae bacterium]|nr:hypothetical protein [Oceanospirillaceae bacterium]MCP5335487.1 hypothetical protein [Oceanospirillaceae bacterium]MCP5349958.1 hypothetical protein [Oceanospirillaceae bacterium]